MAPSNTPRHKTREPQFFDVGVQGRKTGITLKEGTRDEHGIETIDGMFSSPLKSPPKTNGVASPSPSSSVRNGRARQDERHATEPLRESRLATNGKTSFALPRARTPMKTNLKSPARRPPSAGPVSSPFRVGSDTPSRAASLPAVKRRLNFSANHEFSAGESTASPKKDPPKKKLLSGSQKLSKGVESTQPTSARGKRRGLLQSSRRVDSETSSEESAEDDGDMPPANFEDDDPYRLDAHMDADPPSDDEGVSNSDLGDNGGGMEDPMDITSNMDSTSAPAQPPKRRGRPRKPEEPKKKQPAPPKSPLKRGRGRPPKNGVQVLRDVLDNADVPKAEEEEEEEEYARPAKRSRKDLGPAKAPQPKSSSKNKPPPSQRDPNAKITSMKSTNAAKLAMARKGRDESTTSEKTFDLGAKGRSNWHARSEDPDEDDGVQRTRSGRTAVKPMAFWRNERIEYGEGRDIRKIIRTEVVDLPKRKPGRPKGSKNRVKEARESREEPLEEWEQSDGVMKGIVRQWSLKMGEEAIWADNEIAYAAPAIRTQEVANSNFRYAKTLALPFFGSGVVDLPPGGAKRPKNSRKMHMVFYVFEGKVLVTVGETEFSIGKGGMWQVPRGNFYSITNELEKTARIFFAQGCEMEPER